MPQADNDLQHLRSPEVLSYLIPGFSVLLVPLGFEAWGRAKGWLGHTPFATAFDSMVSVLRGQDWIFSAAFLIAALGLGYVAGHIVASISSLCLDRTLILKGFGYPFHSLLRVPKGEAFKERSAAFYRGLFFWVNLYLLLRYWTLFARLDWLLSLFVGGAASAVISSWVRLGSSIAGYYIVASIVLKVLVETPVAVRRALRLHWKELWYRSLKRLGLDPLRGRSFRARWLGALARVDRWSTWAFRVHAGGFDILFGAYTHLTNSADPLREHVIERYKRAFRAKAGVEADEAGSENYWFSYCYVTTVAPELRKLILHWFHLSNFARNLGTAFYLAFFYSLMSLHLQAPVGIPTPLSLALQPGLFLLVAFCMLARYHYLFVCYYSKFLYRAFAYLASEDYVLPAGEAGTAPALKATLPGGFASG